MSLALPDCSAWPLIACSPYLFSESVTLMVDFTSYSRCSYVEFTTELRRKSVQRNLCSEEGDWYKQVKTVASDISKLTTVCFAGNKGNVVAVDKS